MEGISYYQEVINLSLHDDLVSKITLSKNVCNILISHRKLYEYKFEIEISYFSRTGLFTRLDNLVQVIEKEFIDFNLIDKFTSSIIH